MAAEPTTISPALEHLVDEIRDVVQSESEAAVVSQRVADCLEPYLRGGDFLTPAQRVPDPNNYRQHVLYVEPDGSFSIVALVWLPGQATPIHDHISWCVVGVYEGNEYETLYERKKDADGAEYLVESGVKTCPTGTTEALTPPGDIHKVENQGDCLAISLHIYGADIGKLGSSIRRSYSLPVR